MHAHSNDSFSIRLVKGKRITLFNNESANGAKSMNGF